MWPTTWDAITSIDLNTGHDPVDPAYKNVTRHAKWAIPWMEDDRKFAPHSSSRCHCVYILSHAGADLQMLSSLLLFLAILCKPLRS